MKPITYFFLKIEERARRFFEKIPFIQAFLAGAGAIIFWRGIWGLLDASGVTPVVSIIAGTLILICVGVFVQTFLGNTIIIKEVKQEEKMEKMEKKMLQKVEGKEAVEEVTLQQLSLKLDALAKKLEERK